MRRRLRSGRLISLVTGPCAALLLLHCAVAPQAPAPDPLTAPAPVWDLMQLVEMDPERPAELRVGRRNSWHEVRATVASTVPAQIAYPARVPSGALLDLAYAVQAGNEETVPPIRFHVVLTDAAGVEHPLLDRIVDVRARIEDRRWFDTSVDLGPWAGSTGTLSFRAESELPTPAIALFSAPRILVAATDDAPSLLLVTIDCLRADHVHAYGYPRPTTASIDRLSAEGVRFANAYTNAPMTLPSLAQLFTSKVFPGSRDATWLAPFVAAGVPSTAIVNNLFLTLWLTAGRDPEARDGFDRLAFEEHSDARAITDEAIATLDRHPSTRFVLYLHYLDAHSPYTLVPEDSDPFGDPAYRGRVTRSFNDVSARADRYGVEDRQRVIDWYDAGVHSVDQNLGRLIEHLRADGRLDRTLVVVTADHGEELWDHGAFFHGQSLYDELLHVPLVVRLPGGAHAGSVVERAVRGIDIAPAILDWAKLPAPASFSGRSLAQALAQPDAPADLLVATATNPTFPLRYAVRTRDAKLVETLTDGERQLFDLAADPGEQQDVLAAEPALATALGEQLAAARSELWRTGYQLRLVGSGGVYGLSLEGLQKQRTFIALDRAGPPKSHLRLSREASTLGSSGIAGSEPLAVRFDRQRFGATSDPVTLTFSLTNQAEVRLGAAAHVLSGKQIDLLAPELEASMEPPCPPPAEGVRVCLWRSPSAGAAATPGALDAATRERLRALGYAE